MTESDCQKSDGIRLCIKMDSNILHLPDYQFFTWCKSLFGINKGIYNTIDSWFHQSHKRDILARRRCIVDFLSYVTSHEVKRNQQCCVRFGHGGLVQKLKEFTEKERLSE